jgi:AhpD family alkylhydroperoxidase
MGGGENTMNARINLMHINPGVMQAMFGLERQVRQAGFDHKLLDLVRMRASQINGCAYCLDMHSKDARANGETEQRLYGLNAWRETPYYSARERAALEWTEALTLVSQNGVPDEVYDRVREQFSEDELVHLSLAIVAINGWNRLNIAARTVPGDYVPGSLAKVQAAR